VPAEISVRLVRTSRCPRLTWGVGISASSVSPVFKFWRICFTLPPGFLYGRSLPRGPYQFILDGALRIVDQHGSERPLENEQAAGGGANHPETLDEVGYVLERAGDAQCGQRQRSGIPHRRDKLQVVALHRPIAVDRIDDDLAGSEFLHAPG